MVVYADAVVILNGVINYLLLLGAARLRGCAVKPWRLVGGALLGGLYALGTYLFAPLATPVGKIAALVLMICTAFGVRRQSLATGAVFVLLSVGLCGCIYTIFLLLGKKVTAAGFYPVSFSELLLTCSLSAGIVALVLRLCAVRPSEHFVPLRITLDEQTVTLSAFHDTGNSLTDPFSGASVPVVEVAELPMLGKASISAIQQEQYELAMLHLARFSPRLLPFHTVGGHGLLLGIYCPSITVGSHSYSHALIALSPNRVCDRGDYHALIGGNP